MNDDLLALAHELSREGEPFAVATVVRCERPTSAKPGAKALIRPDGTVIGWIGGSCAEPVVVEESLRALRDGQPRFIALVGEGSSGPSRREGVLEYTMTCHSGGTLEIFVEPVLPKLHILLFGSGPVAATLVKLAEAMDFTVTRLPSEITASQLAQLRVTPRTIIVVATHGVFDEEALEHALRSEAGYVGLVSSRKRAGVVVDALRTRGVPADQVSRLKSPAGLDIGARTPEEVAASILAEIVQVSRNWESRAKLAERALERIGEASGTDPVCGMTVKIASAKYRSEAAGRSFYFCCAGCKRTFDQDPAQYAGSAAR